MYPLILKLVFIGFIPSVIYAQANIDVLELEPQTIKIEKDYIGTLKSEEDIEISLEAEGILDKIHVKKGQRIKKGDLVAELRNDKRKIRLKIAKDTLELRQKQYDNEKKTAKTEIKQLEIELEREQQKLNFSLTDLKNEKELAKKRLSILQLQLKDAKDKLEHSQKQLQRDQDSSAKEIKQLEIELNREQEKSGFARTSLKNEKELAKKRLSILQLQLKDAKDKLAFTQSEFQRDQDAFNKQLLAEAAFEKSQYNLSVAQNQYAQIQEKIAQEQISAPTKIDQLKHNSEVQDNQTQLAEQRLALKKLSAKITFEKSQYNLFVAQNQYAQIQEKIAQEQVAAPTKQDQLQHNHNVQKNQAQLTQQKLKQTKLKKPLQLTELLNSVQRAQNDLTLSQEDLNQTVIHAPASGLVNNVHYEQGEFIGKGNTVIQLIKTDHMLIEFAIAEQDIPWLKVGQKAKISVPALKKEFSAQLNFINQESSDNRTFNAEFVIKNPKASLRSGMLAQTHIFLFEEKNQIVIPLNAVLQGFKDQSVFVVKDGTAQKRQVQLGHQFDEFVQIISGLTINDTLVIRGQSFISDGKSVSVKKVEKQTANQVYR